jgi:putative Mn2+ efflux pump MntP
MIASLLFAISGCRVVNPLRRSSDGERRTQRRLEVLAQRVVGLAVSMNVMVCSPGLSAAF